jgi:hypothetical protein
MMQAQQKERKGQVRRVQQLERRVAPSMTRLSKTMIAKFEPDYGKGSRIFFVRNPNMKLKVDLASLGQAPDVRMMVGRANESVEVVVTANRKGEPIRSRATIDLKSPSSNISLRNRSKTVARAEVTIAKVDPAKREVKLQKTDPLPLKAVAPTQVRMTTRGDYAIRGPGLQGTTNINQAVIGTEGRLKKLPPEIAQLSPQPEPPDVQRGKKRR